MSDGMLRVIGEQNKILLQSQMDQPREMKDMFNSVLKNNQNSQNPLAIIEQFKNAGLIPHPAKPQQVGQESIESINARLDAQVKLLTMKMEIEKVRHDWNIQREDKIAQSENIKEWVGTIKDIIEHSVKPTLGEFAKGYGEAMARQKWEAEQQKAAAMQEQQLRQSPRGGYEQAEDGRSPTSTAVPAATTETIFPATTTTTAVLSTGAGTTGATSTAAAISS
jgi:hypothetical protein